MLIMQKSEGLVIDETKIISWAKLTATVFLCYNTLTLCIYAYDFDCRFDDAIKNYHCYKFSRSVFSIQADIFSSVPISMHFVFLKLM